MSDGPIAAVIEVPDGNFIAPVSLECLGMAGRIAAACGRKLLALVMGSEIGGVAEEIARHDLDAVHVIDHELLAYYEPELYLAAFLQFYRSCRPSGVIMGHTLMSADLAPRIAFELGAGLVTDCMGFEWKDGEIHFIRQVMSGHVCAAFSVLRPPFMATVRPRSETAAVPSQEKKGAIEHLSVALDRSGVAVEVVARVAEDDRGIGLQRADVIVAGGRGIGGAEGFAMLEGLAATLGGAVGASRPPCDLGWVPPSAQIGQTGEIVGPSVYIAVGISGSIQHIAGMAGAKTVVAINNDPGAHIFEIADYGVVGDYREVLPSFAGAIEKVRRGETS